MNSLQEMFRQSYKLESPIFYEDFIECGITKVEYFQYLSICEQVRSACICAVGFYNESEQEKHHIINKAFSNLLEWLSLHIEDIEHSKFNAHELLMREIYYLDKYHILSLRYPRHNYPDSDILSKIYRTPDDFRHELEIYIAMILSSKSVNISSDIVYPDSKDKLKKIVHDLDNEYSNLDIPESLYLYDSSNLNSIALWAKKMSEYVTSAIDIKDKLLEVEGLLDAIESSEEYFSPKESVLYIHKGTIKCQRENHSIECVNATIFGRNNTEITLNVNYCNECQIYFLSYSEYERYREQYGILLCNFEFTDLDSEFGDFRRKETSPLMLCGYNVRQGGLSQGERQYILSKLIDEEIMRKDQVINYLSVFIAVNGRKFTNSMARDKWEEDLMFVRNYETSKQKTIQLNGIAQYSNNTH